MQRQLLTQARCNYPPTRASKGSGESQRHLYNMVATWYKKKTDQCRMNSRKNSEGPWQKRVDRALPSQTHPSSAAALPGFNSAG